MIIMFIIIPLFAVAGGNNMPDSVALLFSLAIAVVSLTGAWFSGLTFFVHYWQMLIDEGKIARPAIAEMSESEHSAE